MRPLLELPAWRLLAWLFVAKLALHAVSSLVPEYGYMADELYFLSCADRLAWGYVDHPPFSVALLAAERALIGDSLVAIRVLPALASAAALLFCGLLARELGGGKAAQGLAALCVLVAPIFLASGSYHSMNAIEPGLWSLAALLLAKLANGARPSLWLGLGVLMGLGLLNKISMLWFGLGLGVGLLLTSERRWLATPWPWLAGAIALALFAPHLAWQAANGWPTLEFMRNNALEGARTGGDAALVMQSPAAFIRALVRGMHPLTLPIWLAGLGWYFLGPDRRRFRVLGWIWLTTFLLLIASDRAASYYLAPAFPILFAAGGVAAERLARARSWPKLPIAAAAVLALGGAAIAPMALPLVPPEWIHARTSGGALGEDPLPPHFVYRFGWPELTRAVAGAFATLPPEERSRAGILVTTFGEAGALEHFGPEAGLPAVIATHNNYWLWGPRGHTGEVMLVVAAADSPLLALFEEVERVAPIACRFCEARLQAKAVYVCRRSKRPLPELWAELKNYS